MDRGRRRVHFRVPPGLVSGASDAADELHLKERVNRYAVIRAQAQAKVWVTSVSARI
jgi:hypothetical protein